MDSGGAFDPEALLTPSFRLVTLAKGAPFQKGPLNPEAESLRRWWIPGCGTLAPNQAIYRDTSPTRKRTPLGPYRRPMPRVQGWLPVSYKQVVDPGASDAHLVQMMLSFMDLNDPTRCATFANRSRERERVRARIRERERVCERERESVRAPGADDALFHGPQRPHALRDLRQPVQPVPTLETTQGQIDGFFGQLPFKFYLLEVASVGNQFDVCPWARCATFANRSNLI